MLQVCLNGARGYPAPVSPDVAAEEVRAAVAAGAEECHFHPRDGGGQETLLADHLDAWLEAIRGAAPGVPVGIGTGAWIAPGSSARHRHMQEWRSLPDFVSVNLSEDDAPDVIAMMREKDVGVEAGIWSVADAERLLTAVPPGPLKRILVELPDHDGALDDLHREADAILDLVDGLAPPLLHGEAGSAWPLLRYAAMRGCDMRIGFEDVMVLPDGRPASSNAALVARARDIVSDSIP